MPLSFFTQVRNLVNSQFSFLANPVKAKKLEDRSIEEQVDAQIQKILKEKEDLQKRYKKML